MRAPSLIELEVTVKKGWATGAETVQTIAARAKTQIFFPPMSRSCFGWPRIYPGEQWVERALGGRWERHKNKM
jgi:hypothetical protein